MNNLFFVVMVAIVVFFLSKDNKDNRNNSFYLSTQSTRLLVNLFTCQLIYSFTCTLFPFSTVLFKKLLIYLWQKFDSNEKIQSEKDDKSLAHVDGLSDSIICKL